MTEYEVEVVFHVYAKNADEARSMVDDGCHDALNASMLPSYEILDGAVTEAAGQR